MSTMTLDAIPAYWAAVGDALPDGSGGEIVLAYPANDGNGGEAARAECNQYINDVMLNDGVKLHLVPLYMQANLRREVKVPTSVAGKGAVKEILSFIQTGTVIANGDIGSVTMYVGKDFVGKAVYLYDHAFRHEHTKYGSVPEKKAITSMQDEDYVEGWNACREAMLAAAPTNSVATYGQVGEG
jgi:hypothetical protein